MDIDRDRIDDAVLALLYLGRHNGVRTWKSFDWAEAVERALSQVRAWVEHPFHIVKNLFRHKRLRYRGLLKNAAQLMSRIRRLRRIATALADGRPRPCRGR